MPDLLHTVLNKIDHNRYLAIAAAAVVIILGLSFGCEPKAESPFTDEPVTQRQLEAQIQAYQAKLDGQVKAAQLTYQHTLVELEAQAAAGQANAQAALDDIHKKKQAIALAVESLAQISTAAAGPQFAPVIGSVVGIAGVLLGVGAAADSARKDKVILAIKQEGQTTTT